MVQIGSLIDGRYRVVREIGRGGAGIVYLVLHEQAGQLRAMKVMRPGAGCSMSQVMHPDTGGSASQVMHPDSGTGGEISAYSASGSTLQEELRILRSLRHNMLPQIEDVVFCSEGCCLIMRFIEGDTLEQVVHKRKVSLKEALCWGAQLCEVMQYMHSRPVPVYYFDLKPSNIILDEEGKLFLVDFGSARSIYAGKKTDGKIPQTGTPGYAAPELYRSSAAGDGRADIYSIGAVIFYLLCRQKPRGGETQAECREALRRTGIPEGVMAEETARILSACLQADPAGRPSDCGKLRLRLLRAAGVGQLQRILRRGGEIIHILAAVFSLLCLIASVLCFYASAGMRSRVYTSDLQRAALAGTEKKIDYLREAVTLFPERGEPYLALLDAMTQDGDFSAEENICLTDILYGQGMGRVRENLTCLQENAEAWIQFCYRLGLAYYFLAGETGDKAAAAGWFEKVISADSIENAPDSQNSSPVHAEQIRRDAQILLDMCEYYNMSLSLSGSRSETDLQGLWGKLERLLQTEPERKDGAEKVWILQEWMRVFYDNMDDLRQEEGEEEIREALEAVKEQLSAADEEDAEDLRALFDCILKDWNILCREQSE